MKSTFGKTVLNGYSIYTEMKSGKIKIVLYRRFSTRRADCQAHSFLSTLHRVRFIDTMHEQALSQSR